MKWDWGEYKNTIFIFDRDGHKFLTMFDEDIPEFNVSTGGVLGIKVNKEGHWLHGQWVTVVRPYRFDDEYYEKFPPGHKAPKEVMKCWRMLQLNRLDK
jgi:hypothetical protein